MLKQNIKSDEELINIQSVIKVVKRRKWSLISSIFLFIILAIVYIQIATPVYQATAKIQADPIQPNASAQDSFIMNSMIFLFYETQYEIIQSRKVAESVVDRLNLVEVYKRESEERKREEANNYTLANLKNFFIPRDKESNKNRENDSILRMMLAESIQANLVVEGGTQSQIINISYQNTDPVLAANIVNEVSASYIEFGLEARLTQIKDTAAWLTDQLEDLRISLQNSEDELRDFRIAQNLIDTEQQQRISNTQLQTLNTELVRAQTELSSAKELYEQVVQLEKQGDSYLAISPVLQSNTVRDLVREESTLSRKVEELEERYGDKHPKLISARSELKSAKQNLTREAEKIIENIKKGYRAAQSKVDNVKSLIATTTENLQSYQADNFELTRLEREVENNRRIYESFLAKLMEADVSGDYDASNIRIIDSAITPANPISPNKPIIIILAVIAGSAVGVFLIIFREMTDNVFRVPAQVEDSTGLISLGITPLVSKNKGDVLPEHQYLEDPLSLFSESINSIRTAIMFSNIDNTPKTVLVTSSTASEGKTTLSINLASAFSKLGKTLLLELDLRKPAVARDLNLKKNVGISEFLLHDKELMINEIDSVTGLKVITCGKVPLNPTELISSKKFKAFLEQMKTEFEFIVIDTAPTLPVTDSCILSKYVDATLIAVKAESTKISMLNETLARLNKVQANVAGFVLTQASQKKMSYYGEHYYEQSYYGE